jgi:hypothetical protein
VGRQRIRLELYRYPLESFRPQEQQQTHKLVQLPQSPCRKAFDTSS